LAGLGAEPCVTPSEFLIAQVGWSFCNICFRDWEGFGPNLLTYCMWMKAFERWKYRRNSETNARGTSTEVDLPAPEPKCTIKLINIASPFPVRNPSQFPFVFPTSPSSSSSSLMTVSVSRFRSCSHLPIDVVLATRLAAMAYYHLRRRE